MSIPASLRKSSPLLAAGLLIVFASFTFLAAAPNARRAAPGGESPSGSKRLDKKGVAAAKATAEPRKAVPTPKSEALDLQAAAPAIEPKLKTPDYASGFFAAPQEYVGGAVPFRFLPGATTESRVGTEQNKSYVRLTGHEPYAQDPVNLPSAANGVPPSDTIIDFPRPPRNRVVLERDGDGEDGAILWVDRLESEFVGSQFDHVAPDDFDDPDTVALAVGSFSLKDGHVRPYQALASQARSWWDGQNTGPIMVDPPRGSSDDGYYLLKFHRSHYFAQEAAAKQDLGNLGVEFLDYYGNDTWSVKTNGGRAGLAESHFRTRWMTAFQPYWKVSPDLGRIKQAPQNANLPEYEIRIDGFPGVTIEELKTALRRYGIEATASQTMNKRSAVLCLATKDVIPLLATVPAVLWIEEVSPVLLHNEVSPSSNQSGAFGAATNRPYWQSGVDGYTQIIGITDQGFQGDTSGLAHNCTTPVLANVAVDLTRRKVVRQLGQPALSSAACNNVGNHGTTTSQNAAGNASIFNAVTNRRGIQGGGGCEHTTLGGDTWENMDGVARGARLTLIDFSVSGTELADNTSLFNDGARVGSKSYGTGGVRTYSADAVDNDNFMWTNVDYLVVNSAGNSGQDVINNPATAKNDATIGGNSQIPQLFSFTGAGSSWSTNEVIGSNRPSPTVTGVYTQGGVNAPGQTSASIATCNNADVDHAAPITCVVCTGNAGTSFSTPNTAGTSAMIRDYFQQGFYPTGVASAPDALTVSGPIVKATLIAAADILTANTTQPNRWASTNQWGYGLPILNRALPLSGIGQTPAGLVIEDHAKANTLNTTGQIFTKAIQVSPGTGQLRVGLAWYDPPSAAGSTSTIINNLNLEVVNPAGTITYRGNNFTGAFSNTSATVDTGSPTEAVILSNAMLVSGTWTIRVIAGSVNQTHPTFGGVPFGLVIAGDVLSGSSLRFDKTAYACGGYMNITARDPIAIGAPSVTITTSVGADSETLPAARWSTPDSGLTWNAVLDLSDGGVAVGDSILQVRNGESINGIYLDPHPAHTDPTTSSTANCAGNFVDGAYLIRGGCDESTLVDYHGYLVRYMDGGEDIRYTFGVFNNSASTYRDVQVTMSVSGAGAANVTLLSPPTVYVGTLPPQTVTGAAYLIRVAAATADQTAVSFNFGVTSPSDGYSTPVVVTQSHLLEVDEVRTPQSVTYDFPTTPGGPWTEDPDGWLALGGTDWLWTNLGGAACRTGGCKVGNGWHTGSALCGNYSTATGTNFINAPSIFSPPITRVNASAIRWEWTNMEYCNVLETNAGTQVPPGAPWCHGSWSFNVDPASLPDFDATSGTVWYSSSGNAATAYTSTIRDLYADFVQSAEEGLNGLTATGTSWQVQAAMIIYNNGAPAPADCATDIGWILDNFIFRWDEITLGPDITDPCTATTGVVAFDKYAYMACNNGTVGINLSDSNAAGTGTQTVPVTSAGEPAGEIVTVIETSTPGYFTGTLAISNVSNTAGVLFVNSSDTLTATYSDISPVGTSTATAFVECSLADSLDVIYVSNTFTENGDNDEFADAYETVNMTLVLQNTSASETALNVKAKISSTSSFIDCITDEEASFGDIAPSALDTASDVVTFHISPTADNSVPPALRNATIRVTISGDNFSSSSSDQQFTMELTRDFVLAPLSETFTSDPSPRGWSVLDLGCPAPGGPQVPADPLLELWRLQSFATATDGAGNQNMAVIGSTFNGSNCAGGATTSTNCYRDNINTTLNSPQMKAVVGAHSLTFRQAFEVETTYDGAFLEISKNSGAWSKIATVVPAYNGPEGNYGCTTTELSWQAAARTAFADASADLNLAANGGLVTNDLFKVRWHFRSDSAYIFDGWFVDTVGLGNVQQAQDETAIMTGLPPCACTGASPPTFSGIQSATDLSACGDTGVLLTWNLPSNWNDGTCAATHTFDVRRNGTAIVTGLAGTATSYTDTTGTNNVVYIYSVLARNGGNRTYDGQKTLPAGDFVTNGDVTPPGSPVQTVAKVPSTPNAISNWGAVAGTDTYNFYRATSVGPSINWVRRNPGAIPSTQLNWTEAGALTEPGNLFYTVTALDSCGNESPK